MDLHSSSPYCSRVKCTAFPRLLPLVHPVCQINLVAPSSTTLTLLFKYFPCSQCLQTNARFLLLAFKALWPNPSAKFASHSLLSHSALPGHLAPHFPNSMALYTDFFFFLKECLPPSHLWRFSLSAVSSGGPWTQRKLQLPPLNAHFLP